MKDLSKIKEKWDKELVAVYGGELEIDHFPFDQQLEPGYYACAFHNEPKEGYDSWVEIIKEIGFIGTDRKILSECMKLGIPVCC